ncbi:MAG: Ig-like domain-containing protein, partial [Clostridia bacterium]|nr:Ig-like domain-containing protein [Clostridia bacterium]
SAKIKIDKTELVLLIGETDVITAQTTDENATVEWDSSNPAICTVENGVVTGMNKGQAIISATYGGESVYCAVTVNARSNPASDVGYTIELNRDSVRLTSEETFNIVAELYDTKNEKVENATFTYTSSAPSVVSVNDEGKITAIANGTAKIVVKYSDDADWISAVLSVTVADEYMVELQPLTSDPEINSQVNLVYSVLKKGEVIEYPANQVSVTSTNSSIVRYENGKLITGNAGIAEITVTLLTENASATMEVIVLDPNAPAIVLGCENFELYTNSSMEIPVTGVSWGTLVYTVSNDEFTVNDGVIYAPATADQCTLTIRHRETRQQIQCTVTAKQFDTCIMTASQFMEIGVLKSGEEVYLGADIDLSAEEWTAKAGLSFVNSDIVLAYLVEELNAKIDGRGHKITVRYDHSCADNAQLAGIFAKITENGQVSNLVIDYEAKYYGQDDATSGVNQAVKQSVVTYFNLGRVWNNHVTARFYSDNYANRESLIGYWGGSIHNNMLDIQVFKNNSAIAKGSFLWEQKGGISQNNVVVNPNITSASHATLFDTQDDFIDGWNTFAGKNEWINGGWSVDGRYLKLSDTTVYTKSIGVVSGLEVSSQSIVNWNEVNGAESYKLRIKWSDENDWTNLMDSNVPSWDVGSYLKNMGATALNAKAGKYISLQVACDMGSSGMGDWYELSNALGTETSQGSGTKNLVLGIAGDANSLKTL